MYNSEMFIIKFQAMVFVLWHRETVFGNNEKARVKGGLEYKSAGVIIVWKSLTHLFSRALHEYSLRLSA